MKAAFIPEVNDELDTQNFEKFEEVSKYPFWLPFALLCYFFNCLTYENLVPCVWLLQSDNQVPTTTKSGPWRKVSTPKRILFFAMAFSYFTTGVL